LIKRMTMLVRRDDLTVEEFSQYWLGKHADIVRGMPRLHRYLQNHIVRSLESVGDDPRFRVHGIPELWFLDEEAKSVAFASSAAKLLPEDEKNFIQGITIFAVEERVVHEGAGSAKVMLLVRRSSPIPGDAEADHRWCKELTAALPDLRRAVVNRVLSSEHRPGVWREPSGPDLIIETRFDSVASAEKAFLSDAFAVRLDQSADVQFAAYLVDEHPIIEPFAAENLG
jgi:uncharacterized protein (TIGR02118 family)